MPVRCLLLWDPGMCISIEETGCLLTVVSGCGKTTLLNVLAHRATQASSVSKEVLVNGKDVSGSQFRQISCYVEQEDALLGALTVRETLAFAAKLSLPR
jgi:ABC-type multidrug transport system ATPase subunit